MDIVAIIGGIFSFMFFGIFFIEGDIKMARIFFGAFVVTQLCWFGWFLPEKKVVTIITTDYYETMKFSKPVRITKTKTHKPLMALSEKVILEVEVDGF